MIYSSFQNTLFTYLWQVKSAWAGVRLRKQCALKQDMPFNGGIGNTKCYFKIIAMPWREPLGGVP